MRENKPTEAIKRFVDAEKYAKAEEFCLKKDRTDRSLGLLTTLLKIYFESYEKYMKEGTTCIEESRT